MPWTRLKVRGWPAWLWLSVGKKGETYWVRHRTKDLYVEQRIEGRIATWKDAARLGQKILDEARVGKTDKNLPLNLVRTEALCVEVVKLRGARRLATFQNTEMEMRNHLIPWFNKNAPFAVDLNDESLWEKFKNEKRLANPRCPLFSHWKFFVMVVKHAYRRGFLKRPILIKFDEAREDFRQRGMLIPDEHFALLVRHARQTWKDRAILQRLTGMRPGEARSLQRSRIEFVNGFAKVSLTADDTKTKTARSFMVRAPIALEILRRRLKKPEATWLFPMQGKRRGKVPMSPRLHGWHSALSRAGLGDVGYTPHDLRHTFLTNEFKRPNARHAVICYGAGLSIEEAQKTYLHFTAEDTAEMAEEIAKESLKMTRLLVG